MSMSQKVRESMLPRLRQRYVNRGRQGRTRMIDDELCEQFGYTRKHAIKLLNAHTDWGGDPTVRKGRPPEYGPEVAEVLWRIWKVAEQPCGKRPVAMLELWLPHYEAKHFLLESAATERAQKRGVNAECIPLDEALPDHHVLPPDRLFDRQWALALLDQTLNTLQHELSDQGKAEVFNVLKP